MKEKLKVAFCVILVTAATIGIIEGILHLTASAAEYEIPVVNTTDNRVNIRGESHIAPGNPVFLDEDSDPDFAGSLTLIRGGNVNLLDDQLESMADQIADYLESARISELHFITPVRLYSKNDKGTTDLGYAIIDCEKQGSGKNATIIVRIDATVRCLNDDGGNEDRIESRCYFAIRTGEETTNSQPQEIALG